MLLGKENGVKVWPLVKGKQKKIVHDGVGMCERSIDEVLMNGGRFRDLDQRNSQFCRNCGKEHQGRGQSH